MGDNRDRASPDIRVAMLEEEPYGRVLGTPTHSPASYKVGPNRRAIPWRGEENLAPSLPLPGSGCFSLRKERTTFFRNVTRWIAFCTAFKVRYKLRDLCCGWKKDDRHAFKCAKHHSTDTTRGHRSMVHPHGNKYENGSQPHIQRDYRKVVLTPLMLFELVIFPLLFLP